MEEKNAGKPKFPGKFNREADAFASLDKGYNEILTKSESAQTQFEDALKATFKELQDSLTKSLDGHAQHIEHSTAEMNKRIGEAWKKTQDALDQQFENLDKQLQQELSRALEVMGRNLASISEKFANDSTPLADSLRDVVQAVRRASA